MNKNFMNKALEPCFAQKPDLGVKMKRFLNFKNSNIEMQEDLASTIIQFSKITGILK